MGTSVPMSDFLPKISARYLNEIQVTSFPHNNVDMLHIDTQYDYNPITILSNDKC